MNATAKRTAGEYAATLVEDGMIVGLGTGSTAHYFIEALAARAKAGLEFSVIASSNRSLELAKKHNLRLADINRISSIDFTADGADAVDENFCLIKGGGGAHLREKLLASLSNKLYILVDESKLTKEFSGINLPIEVIPFAHEATGRQIQNLGLKGTFRITDEEKLFITDNENYIFDGILSEGKNLDILQQELLSIPGVVETGLFLHFATHLVVANNEGKCCCKRINN